MTEIATTGKLVNDVGIGVTAVIIVFGVFIFLLRNSIITQNNDRKEHNKSQVQALEKVAESNNNVAEALSLIREMFIERTNSINNKQDIMLGRLVAHCNDAGRVEAMAARVQESSLKIEERTKACAERAQSFRRGDTNGK